MDFSNVVRQEDGPEIDGELAQLTLVKQWMLFPFSLSLSLSLLLGFVADYCFQKKLCSGVNILYATQ